MYATVSSHCPSSPPHSILVLPVEWMFFFSGTCQSSSQLSTLVFSSGWVFLSPLTDLKSDLGVHISASSSQNASHSFCTFGLFKARALFLTPVALKSAPAIKRNQLLKTGHVTSTVSSSALVPSSGGFDVTRFFILGSVSWRLPRWGWILFVIATGVSPSSSFHTVWPVLILILYLWI